MFEPVVVKQILSPTRVMVSCSSSACAGCKSEMFCNTKGRVFEAVNDKKLALETGMVVNLYLKPARTVASAAITLLIPLFCFPLCYYIFRSLGEKPATLLGFLGVALGFVLVGIYFKLTKSKYMPSVSEIIA